MAQRVYGMALGYEDLNDHDQLRSDPALAVIVGKEDVKGEYRRVEQDRGKALAGKSTLNRLELTGAGPFSTDPYKKIGRDDAAIDRLMVDHFLESHEKPPLQIILDADATDDPIHGNQEGRFYHGYYGHYCYLPLYIFCGEFLLCARLRRADIDACAGTVDELKRIVDQIRQKWPKVQIVLRGDSGFCREEILAWCEANGVDYVIGLAKNAVLIREIGKELEKAEKKFRKTGKAARVFKDFQYSTQETWSRKRRVIAKAEYLKLGPNPRFVVTSLPSRQLGARYIYERMYCARGDMENRIKEQQLGLVRGSDEHRHDARQSTPALLLIGGLYADGGHAPDRPEGNEFGECPVRHDSCEATQDRRPDSGHRAPRLVPHGRGLSLRRRLRPGLRQPPEAPSALLKSLQICFAHSPDARRRVDSCANFDSMSRRFLRSASSFGVDSPMPAPSLGRCHHC